MNLSFPDTDRLTPIGHVLKPHGFKGEVLISLEDSRVHLKKPKWFFILIDGGHVPFLIEKFSRSVDTAIAKLQDVNNEDQAKAICSMEVCVESNAPLDDELALDKSDVTGFKVVDKEHGEIGVVQRIMELPQQKLLVVIRNTKEVLIPFSKPILQKIERKTKTVFVDLPEGLLEIF